MEPPYRKARIPRLSREFGLQDGEYALISRSRTGPSDSNTANAGRELAFTAVDLFLRQVVEKSLLGMASTRAAPARVFGQRTRDRGKAE
jgi:hypothetical protein